MAVIQSGATSDLLTVEPVGKAIRVAEYPKDANFYSVRAATGVLGAALAAGATLFSMRQAAAPTKSIYITGIDVQFACTVAFTTASQQLFVIERFSTATPSGGTAYTPLRHSTSYPASEAVDIRASTTAALTVTSVVFEGFQVPILGAASPLVSSTVGASFDLREGPIRLQANEGLCIRNVVVWPAAGTGVLTAQIRWNER